MQYEVEAGGRTRHVVVTRTGDSFAVTLGGRTWMVDAARIDVNTLSLLLDTVSSTNSSAAGRMSGTGGHTPGPAPGDTRRRGYEVSIVADPAGGRLTAHVGSTPIPVILNGLRRWGRKDDGGGAGEGPQRLVAPMPGKVVRVLVKPGDVVGARQAIVVVEAMKMENELRASRDGTVSEVHAHEGISVDAGALLIVIQ
jgi:biotin carboxyl carrier protein